MNSFLSTKGYPGTRDFYPDLQRKRNWLFQKIHKILGSFGYEEYDGPFLEPFELYASKSSEEIVSNQLYSFIDKGERKVAIRPEMTPTLTRMVAAKNKELLRPIRWYSNPTCMRYERPQRGRLREFTQLNVDVLGGNPTDEDVEIVLTIVELMRNLGAKDSDFEIRINHRGVINNFLYDYLKISKENMTSVMRLLDKFEKLSPTEFADFGKELNISEENITNIQKLFLATPQDVMLELEKICGASDANYVALKERYEILQKVLGNSACVRVDPSIMRGFDYYTGFVFEVFDTSPQNRRALFGGGRYDNLVGAFGSDPLSGVGYGTSDVSLLNFCEIHEILPNVASSIDISVLRFSDADRVLALELADALRKTGFSVAAPLSGHKFGKQIQHAEKIGAKVVVFRGEDEIKENNFAVKWLKSGKQNKYLLTDIGVFVQDFKAEFK